MKIPKQAKKVFGGIIFDVYQWKQKMFDGTTEIFEMLDRANTIQVIATMDDKIVLIFEEQPTLKPKYSVIGGRQDEWETPLECAKRELLEETGLTSDDWELWEEIEPYNKMDWTITRFIARNCKKKSEQKLDAGEKIELRPVNFEKFVDIVASDNFRSTDISIAILKMHYNNTLDKFRKKLFKKERLNRRTLKDSTLKN